MDVWVRFGSAWAGVHWGLTGLIWPFGAWCAGAHYWSSGHLSLVLMSLHTVTSLSWLKTLLVTIPIGTSFFIPHDIWRRLHLYATLWRMYPRSLGAVLLRWPTECQYSKWRLIIFWSMSEKMREKSHQALPTYLVVSGIFVLVSGPDQYICSRAYPSFLNSPSSCPRTSLLSLQATWTFICYVLSSLTSFYGKTTRVQSQNSNEFRSHLYCAFDLISKEHFSFAYVF